MVSLPYLDSAVSPVKVASRHPTLGGLGSLSRSLPVLLFLKSMFIVNIYASFSALSKIHIVVSVHARHTANFSKFLYGMGYALDFIGELFLAPVHFGPHSTNVSLAIFLNRASSHFKRVILVKPPLSRAPLR